MRRSGNHQSQLLPPISTSHSERWQERWHRVRSHCRIQRNCHCQLRALLHRVTYRTNYGKITSIRDRLFQLIKSRRIFASFDVFRLALSILLTLDETKKTKVSTAFLTAVRRGNDVRLTLA